MIPQEAVGQLCLLIRMDDVHSLFQAGLVRTAESLLRRGKNRDGKGSIRAGARDQIVWLVEAGQLAPNFLATIPDDVRSQIMSQRRSGQSRINELFRLVQGRVVSRNALETVARQLDPMKRMRDARRILAGEGILVLGHQDEDPETARKYGLPVLKKGEAISVRI